MSLTRPGVVQMSKALQVDPDINLREILEISQSDSYSVQYSPFLQGPGGQLGGTIIRRASPIKGMSEDEIEERYPEIHAGLQKAKEMAIDAAEDGVAVIKQDGRYKIVSQTAANLAMDGKKGASLVKGNLGGYDEALDVVSEKGKRAHRPRIA